MMKKKNSKDIKEEKPFENVESEGTVLLELKETKHSDLTGKKRQHYDFYSPDEKFKRYGKKITKIDLNTNIIMKMGDLDTTVLFDEPTIFTYLVGVLGENEYPIRLKNVDKRIFLHDMDLFKFIFKNIVLIDDFLVVLLAFFISSTDDEDELQNLTEYIRYVYSNQGDPDVFEDLIYLNSQVEMAITDQGSGIMEHMASSYEVVSMYKIKNYFEVSKQGTSFITSGFLSSMAEMGLIIDSRRDNDMEFGDLETEVEEKPDLRELQGAYLFPPGSNPIYYLIKNQNNEIYQIFHVEDSFYLLDDEELLEWVRYSNPNLILDLKNIKVIPKKKIKTTKLIKTKTKKAKKAEKQKKKDKSKKKKVKKKPKKEKKTYSDIIKLKKGVKEVKKEVDPISIKEPKIKPKKNARNLVFHEFSNVVEKYEKEIEKKKWKKQEKRGDKITTYEKIRVCLVHKGKIDGLTYICPNCGSLYCFKCVKALNKKGEVCWNCGAEFNL
jgi:predicted RNA-binding Zn-ribbon protein involved in translation (DUF1610 family)